MYTHKVHPYTYLHLCIYTCTNTRTRIDINMRIYCRVSIPRIRWHNVYTQSAPIYIFTRMYIYIYKYTHTYRYIYTYILSSVDSTYSLTQCIHTKCTHIYIYMYVYIHVQIHAHMYIYIYMYILALIHILLVSTSRVLQSAITFMSHAEPARHSNRQSHIYIWSFSL